MNNSVIEYLNRDTRRVAKLVNETFWRLMEPTTDIDRVMPITSYPMASLLMLKMSAGKPTIASLVAPEQEIPIQRTRMTLSEELTNKLKIGKQISWNESHFELMEKLALYQAQSGSAEVTNAIEKYVLGSVVDLVPSIYEKSTMLMMKVVTTGTCVFTDPLSGAQVSLDYSDKTIADLMPSALTAGARWGQAATADALGDLETHARSYYDNFGMFPSELSMPWETLREIADQTSTKHASFSRRGATNTQADDLANLYLEDAEAIDLIRQRTKVNSVNLIDSQYTEEAADGSTTDKYFLERDYYFFSAPGMFERAFVPTIENNRQQGIYVRSKEVNDAPRQERTVAVGSFVPMVADPRKIAARKVN